MTGFPININSDNVIAPALDMIMSAAAKAKSISEIKGKILTLSF